MGELELGRGEFGGESWLGRVLLLVQDGADSEEVVGVHRRNVAAAAGLEGEGG